MNENKISMEIVNSNAAGIDIASQMHYVAVPSDRDEQSVRKFGSFTDDLQKMGWLDESGKFSHLNDDFILTSIPARERVLEGAITVAGSHGVDGQMKLTLPNEEIAQFLRTLVMSLGIQASVLVNSGGAYSFKFAHQRAKRRKNSTYEREKSA